MARKKQQTPEIAPAQVINPAVVESKPTVDLKGKTIVAAQKFGRWFVYIQGVNPKDLKTGCPCKTAKSAIRYMYLLKNRYGAQISQNIYDRLEFEAQREAQAEALAKAELQEEGV